MCLEAGRGRPGPDRLHPAPADRRRHHRRPHRRGAWASPLGRSVGYKIRFDDRTSRDTRIKVLTDGMLLAETQSDPRLLEYDTLIIDEAHERSLNIDFLLGIVKTLLPVRPDLKLIITSATLDIEKFRRAFDGAPRPRGRRPDVPGRGRIPAARPGGRRRTARTPITSTWRSRPWTISGGTGRAGDILVFMPTEQDILETCEILEGRRYPGVTRPAALRPPPRPPAGPGLFGPGPKIVVATNVAETSLTIPGIRYVVDTGLARISQYLPGAAHQQPAHPADLAEQRRPAQGPLRPRPGRALRPALLRGRTTRRGRRSPRPRSCAPTWPRSSCG